MIRAASIGLLSTLVLLSGLAAPACAAAGQKLGPAQARHGDYWLSRDMQRLVFWQAPSGTRGTTSAAAGTR